MRMKALVCATIIGVASLATAAAASAEVVSLVCRVQVIAPNGHHDIGRRLDIDLAHRTVRISDNLGRGWMFKNEYPYVSANRDRFLLEQGGGKQSYVDRVSGMYFFHNQADGVTMHGPCKRTEPARPRF